MDTRPLIDAQELATLLKEGRRDVKIVDATYVLPGSPADPVKEFEARRIGNAVFFDVDAIADRNTDLPHMLPSSAEFSDAAEKLGISSGDLVVVYSQSGIPMAAARAWWMFRIFGHDKVRVLDGGLPAWVAAGHSVNTDAPSLPPKRGRFSPSFRPSLLCDAVAIKSALGNGDILVLDARPPGRFAGKDPEPRPGLRSGHIPGSRNIPAASLVDPATMRLKNDKDLYSILGESCSHRGKVVASCGSGVTACTIAFALFILGREDVAVYDGAWAEWGKESASYPCDKLP